MLNGNKKNITIIIVAVLNLLLTIGAVASLDKMLPLKFYAQNPFKMVSKGSLLIIPIVIIVLSALQVVYRLKTIQKPVNTFRRVEDAIFVGVVGLLMIINCVFVSVGHDNTGTPVVSFNIPVIGVIMAVIATLLAMYASSLPINKFGSKIGFRTQETLSNEKAWRVGNKFVALCGFLSSLLFVFIAAYFVLVRFKWHYLVTAIALTCILIGYAPRLYIKRIISMNKAE